MPDEGSIKLIPLQPGQIKIAVGYRDWSLGKFGVIQVNRLVIQANHDNSMINISVPVGQFATLNKNNAWTIMG